jgi:hypothetical protein
MGEDYLRSEDKFKLHSEVTQTVNQRFLLAGAAVTISASLLARFFKDPLSMTADDLRHAAWTSVVVAFLLWVLNLQSRYLWRKLRSFTVYLRITGSSKWEEDWYEFRDEAKSKKKRLNHYERFRYRVTHADWFSNRIIFATLHAIWALLVIAHWCAICLNGKIADMTLLQNVLCGISVLISVVFFTWAFREQDLDEIEIKKCWREVVSVREAASPRKSARKARGAKHRQPDLPETGGEEAPP